MRFLPLILCVWVVAIAWGQVPSGTLMINGGNPYTNELKATLYITGENATKMMISTDPSFASAQWETFKPGNREIRLEPGDGRKQVFLKLMDAKQNVSSVIEAEIILDQTPPTGSFTLEKEGESNKVTVRFSAQGATQYRLSNREDFKASEWKSYKSIVTGWLLTPGDGEKTVFAQLKDAAGNVSQTLSAKITLDRAEPSNVSLVINNGDYFTRSPQVTLSITAQDAKEIKLPGSDSWQPFTSPISYTLPAGDGEKIVEITVRSAAGKESKAKDKIVLDQTPPTQTAIAILQNTQSPIATRKVDLKLTAFEAEEMMISASPDFAGSRWIPYRQNYYGWDLGGEGEKTVYAKFRDAAGNESAPVYATASVDRSAPGEVRIEIKAKDMAIVEATNQKITNKQNEPVTLIISGADATEMLISNSPNFKGASWQPFKNKIEGWKLDAKDDGDHFVYLKLRDNAGNETRTVADNITLDTEPPFNNKISIAKNPVYCTSPERKVELILSSTKADYMLIYNDGNDQTSQWEPYAPTKTWVLSEGNGLKTISAKFKDFVGNESAPVSTKIILDNEGPTGAQIQINGGEKITNDPDKRVFIAVAANDAKMMQISNSPDFAGAKWMAMATTNFVHRLEGEDGLKTVYARFMDEAGNISQTVSASITLDRKAPLPAFIKINDGQKITNSTKKVKLTLQAEGATEMLISNRYDFADAEWQPYKTELDWTLRSGQGDKIVYARFRSAAGNLSRIIFAQIWVDEEAPKNGKLIINENERFCTDPSAQVTLKLLAQEATEMIISCSPDFAGANWQPYQRIIPAFSLCGEDGQKTLYAKFRDEAGNETEPVSASIILDRQLPIVEEIILDKAAPYTNNPQGIIQIDLKVSGATEMMISNSDKFMAPAQWETFSYTKSWTLAKGGYGKKTVYFRFRDEAGNTTLPVAKSIIHDAQPPVFRAFSINQGKSITTESTVALTIDALDATEMMVSTNPNFVDASWQPFTSLLRWELDSERGLKTLYVKLRDAAMNESAPKSASITFVDTE